MSDLPVKQTWIARVFTGIVRAFGKVEKKPLEVNHGASWQNPYGIRPGYAPEIAMSAYGGHGYTYAAVSRASTDLAGLPLRLVSGEGSDAQIIDNHPIKDLLNQPSTFMDGYLFREQICTDLILSGDAFVLLLGLSEQPDSIVRLHPQEVEIITTGTGITGYRHDSSGSVVVYEPDRVIHIRSASFEKGPKGLYGTGAIRPLSREINADINAQKLASDSSAKGRPDILLYPKDPADIWGHERRREILDQYRGLASEGGAMVLSGQVEVEPLKLTPREMEFEASRTMARQSISAVTGVYPSVLGLPSANYATSRQQARHYWQVQIHRAHKLSQVFTAIAKKWDPSFRVEHDFSSVEALQDVRTQQLERIKLHIENGMSAADAYAYEGLEDAPIVSREVSSEVLPENEPETSPEDIRSLIRMFGSLEGKAVGDVDPTNFPSEGDDLKVSLRNSDYQVFDVDFAERIKNDYPEIWRLGGNTLGNTQYTRLTKVVDQGEVISETDEKAVRLREAWAARHFKDFRIAGVVAQMKWLVVGSRGEKYMKDLIKERQKSLQMSAASEASPEHIKTLAHMFAKTMKENKQLDDARQRQWENWIEKAHKPAENKLRKAAEEYLRGAKLRYQDRIKEHVTQTRTLNGSVLKAVNDWGALLSVEAEKVFAEESLGDVWSKVWMLSGNEELSRVYRLANLDRPLDLVFGSRVLERQMIAKMISEITDTTANHIAEIVQAGLTDGLSVDEIASEIEGASVFTRQRARLIGRTEATRSVNASSVEAYKIANLEGLKVQKEWLTSQDEKVRPEQEGDNPMYNHKVLDGQRQNPEMPFVSGPFEGQGPGQFEVAGMDCNCRCTVIPYVE